MPHPSILAIVGPTAVGKTEVAMRMVERWPMEIVAADAFQVYRGLDIGTGKPTPAMRERVAHHGLDLADPRDQFNVSLFLASAVPAIEDIWRRGKLPCVVVGTGLYLQALRRGLMPAPPGDPGRRTALERQARSEGAEPLYRRLKAIDPAAAALIPPQNVRRVVRALEVHELTGRPFSSWKTETAPALKADWRVIGLRRPRDLLRKRIAERVQRMIAEGWVEEVRGLLNRGLPLSAPGFSAIGYRELAEWVIQSSGPFESVVDRIVLATGQYAKRQDTWFRKEPVEQWLDPNDIADCTLHITHFMERKK